MDDLTRGILTEVTAFALLALAVALVLFAFLRSRHPELSWHLRGNVYTQPYGRIDLVVVGLIMSLFLAVILSEPAADGASGGVPAGTVTEKSGAPVSEEDALPIQMATQVLFQFTLIGSLLVYLTAGRGFNLSEIFGFRQMSVLRAGLIALAVLIPVVWIVELSSMLANRILDRSLPEAEPQQIVKTFVETRSGALKAMIGFSAVVVAPLCEEVIFRGFVYPVLKRHTERIFAAVLTGLLFGIVHFHVPSLVPLAVLGVLFALAYELTGCLWVPIFLHALFNGSQTAKMLYPEVNWWW